MMLIRIVMKMRLASLMPLKVVPPPASSGPKRLEARRSARKVTTRSVISDALGL